MTDFIEFEEVGEQIPTAEEMEENYHYAQVQEAKSLFFHNITKNDIPFIVNLMVESVLEKGDVLETAEKVKIMEQIIEQFKADKRYKEYAIEKLEPYGKAGYVTKSGSLIEIMEAGTKYDFSNCNDAEMQKLEEEKASLDAKIKARQNYLKSLKKATPVLDEDGEPIANEDGEQLMIYPPGKTSTTTYKVSLSK